MKIIKYKKIKNKYKVYLDNEEIDLYERIILDNNLLLKKEIDNKLLDKVKEENQKEESYELALNYINKKMRTKKEIYNYLSKKGYSKEQIEEVISRLEEKNLINDEIYIKSYMIDRINLSNDGPEKIKYYLINSGFKEEYVDKYIKELDAEIITEKLDKLIDKKIKTIKNCSGSLLKYKLLTYFINLGYSKYMIEELLETKNLKSNNGEKEYTKLYNKYSKKYCGYELENIIRQKLYQKGFDYNEIKKNID